MNRRAFIGIVAGTLLAAPLAAAAQQARMPRIGVLLPAEPASPTEPDASAFRQGLHALGYVEGQNVVVEYRHAHGKAELHTELIAQLVRLPVNVMVVRSGAATLAAKKVTQTVPIVMVGGGEFRQLALLPRWRQTPSTPPAGAMTGYCSAADLPLYFSAHLTARRSYPMQNWMQVCTIACSSLESKDIEQ